MKRKRFRIVFSTIFQNSGDATRALEIAKAIRDNHESEPIEISFISRGSRFEEAAEQEGFEIYHAQPKLGGIQYLDDFKTRFGELIGETGLAKKILQGEIDAYRVLEPDLLIYGFWPVASIARRMAIPRTPAMAFLPLPLTERFLDTVHRFPFEMPLSRLPQRLQNLLISIVPSNVKLHLPALRHGCIRKAAEQSGWRGEPLSNLFRMLDSDMFLVNDFPDFYPEGLFDKRVVFTGPIFSQPTRSEITDEKIVRLLHSDDKPKLFCTLGSSGGKAALLEIISMFNGCDRRWRGLVLCPPSVCPINEARSLLKNPDVVLTDAFVPAAEINAHVDAVVCHGGQGTLQTAILSGTPLVGFPAQPEQQMNLQHLAEYGMAICLPPYKWNAKNIGDALNRLFGTPHYKQQALKLQRRASELDARRTIVEIVNRVINGRKQKT